MKISCYRFKAKELRRNDFKYRTPDKNGDFANIILGFDRFEDYGNSPKHGASVGPVAGRIAKASFELNGRSYQLVSSMATRKPHSGFTSWDGVIFSRQRTSQTRALTFTQSVQTDGRFPQI